MDLCARVTVTAVGTDVHTDSPPLWVGILEESLLVAIALFSLITWAFIINSAERLAGD
jgi:hypothetical protein